MGIVTIIDITECNYQSNLIPFLSTHCPGNIHMQGNANRNKNGEVCHQCWIGNTVPDSDT